MATQQAEIQQLRAKLAETESSPAPQVQIPHDQEDVPLNDDEMATLFTFYDSDNSGLVDRSELRHMARLCGLPAGTLDTMRSRRHEKVSLVQFVQRLSELCEVNPSWGPLLRLQLRVLPRRATQQPHASPQGNEEPQSMATAASTLFDACDFDADGGLDAEEVDILIQSLFADDFDFGLSDTLTTAAAEAKVDLLVHCARYLYK